MLRALRIDKLNLAALEATLSLWMSGASRPGIPVVRMLTMGIDEIDHRAQALATAITASGRARCDVIDGASTTGGGSAPGSSLPTRLVSVAPTSMTAAVLEEALRSADPPVIVRIQEDRVVIDLRTVASEDDGVIADLIRRA